MSFAFLSFPSLLLRELILPNRANTKRAAGAEKIVHTGGIRRKYDVLSQKKCVFEAENVGVFFVSNPPWGYRVPPDLKHLSKITRFLRILSPMSESTVLQSYTV